MNTRPLGLLALIATVLATTACGIERRQERREERREDRKDTVSQAVPADAVAAAPARLRRAV